MIRHCACRHCGTALIIGHPEALLRERAKELSRKSASIIERITGSAKRKAREIEERLVHAFYQADAARHRTLPPRCPSCHARDGRELPWWEPR